MEHMGISDFDVNHLSGVVLYKVCDFCVDWKSKIEAIAGHNFLR